MSGLFENRTALVTGAGSGIGTAIASELAAGGARVILADMDRAGLEATAEAIAKAGGTAASFEADVSDPDEVGDMVAFAETTYGPLQLAVNNAGIGGPAALTGDYPLDGWRRVMDVNLDGVFYSVRAEIAAMNRHGKPSAIVNMASILGSVGFDTACAYVSAKHGVVGLTKVAASEYATRNIRINAVGPGFIDTPLLSENLDADALAAIKSLHPIQRLGTIQEVSALTCFLLSDAASFITGSYHLVDGGYTAK